jgi:hypothetical protein
MSNQRNNKNHLFRLHYNESIESNLQIFTPSNSLIDIQEFKLPKISSKPTHIDLKTIKLLPVAYSSNKYFV